MNNNIYCGNCGKLGHIYRKCPHPVISLGMIAYFLDEANNPYFVMIRRKDTLAYVEFIRGRYTYIDDMEYLITLLNAMTICERERIKTLSFDALWDGLWINPNNKCYKTEYDNSKKKYRTLVKGVMYNGTITTIRTLLENVTTQWNTAEWGFPKGRRNMLENNLSCAEREFNEETNYTPLDYIFYSDIPAITEVYTSSNNQIYKQIYYLCQLKTFKKPYIDSDNRNQIGEIGEISLENVEGVKRRLLSHRHSSYEQKINILRTAIKHINNIHSTEIPLIDP